MTDIDGWGNFALYYDTFQFLRCGDKRTFPERIGPVHVSEISRQDLPAGDLTELDRELVFVNDRVGNVAQRRNLVAVGYEDYISLEPFSPLPQQDPALGAWLQASFDYLAAGVGPKGTLSQRIGA